MQLITCSFDIYHTYLDMEMKRNSQILSCLAKISSDLQAKVSFAIFENEETDLI